MKIVDIVAHLAPTEQGGATEYRKPPLAQSGAKTDPCSVEHRQIGRLTPRSSHSMS